MRKGQLKNETSMTEVFNKVATDFKGVKGITASRLLSGFFGSGKHKNVSTFGATKHWLDSKVRQGTMEKINFGGREITYFSKGSKLD